MGGLCSYTPKSKVLPQAPIKKYKTLPTAEETSKLAEIEVQAFRGQFKVDDLKFEDVGSSPILGEGRECEIPSMGDLLWMYARASKNENVKGWNGFMSKLYHFHDCIHEMSRITFLPFVRLPPGDLDTINTTIHMARQKSSQLAQKTTFITYDQPLYLKAKGIIASCNIPDTVIRLGGFHMLMSFLGAVGYLMAGSGLTQVLCTVYAPLSADKMLSGHAYARAIRGHFLVHEVLGELILANAQYRMDEADELVQNVVDDSGFSLTDVLQSEALQTLLLKVQDSMAQFVNQGSTASLWVQYFNMITLVKNFIIAERTGNWTLHLKCVRNMIPYFYSSGHNLYAKCSHLYLQDMLKLEDNMDETEYRQFVDGFFAIGRSEEVWSGIWTDMVIEQQLMRSIKVTGGLVHGR